MNQPYARVNQPYATLTLASALRKMFGVQLYKNNARALLSRILSILNLDWLQHVRSVRRMYEFSFRVCAVMKNLEKSWNLNDWRSLKIFKNFKSHGKVMENRLSLYQVTKMTISANKKM